MVTFSCTTPYHYNAIAYSSQSTKERMQNLDRGAVTKAVSCNVFVYSCTTLDCIDPRILYCVCEQ